MNKLGMFFTSAVFAVSAPGSSASGADLWNVELAGVKLKQDCAAARSTLHDPKWREIQNGDEYVFTSEQEVIYVGCLKTPVGKLVSSVTYYTTSELVPQQEMLARVTQRFGTPGQIRRGDFYEEQVVTTWGDAPAGSHVVGRANPKTGGGPYAEYVFSPRGYLTKDFRHTHKIVLYVGQTWYEEQTAAVKEEETKRMRETTKPSF